MKDAGRENLGFRMMLLRRKAQKPSAEPEVPKLPNPANTEPHLEGAGAEA